MAAYWKKWLVFTLCLMTSSTTAEPLLIGAEDDWAPYCERDKEDGQPRGLAPELVKAVFAAEGIEIVFRTLPFARCMHDAKSGKLAGCFNATITEENRYQYYWHDTPMFEEDLASEPQRDLKLTSLEGKRVGITLGYTYPTDFMENPRITRFQAKSDAQILEMLVRGRVDYILMNGMPGYLKIQQKQLAGKVVKVGKLSTDGFWLAFSRNAPQGEALAKQFEQGLQKIKNNGTYETLIRQFETRLGLH
ncbi:transporter substrate-binding domain-containing protein [Aeromonas allosaccharophila]|uniref:substrate-binding periplasmic protein n=1 Tax=Aeromonas allosaccharophila TaxID=656 RepID=UPI0013C55E3E|nr:transporter substrate-binding domain-containing protein [Aeromonas allosaccharophila]WDO01193.1 transporter substrate-binding domain-containing protein [Aeromonas allosaccharophila]